MRFQPDLTALAPWVGAFGITPDTRIATPLGARSARDLRVGDLVTTRDAGAQPLIDVREAIAAPAERKHYPVRIMAGALGFGVPHVDISLGPQHRVLFEHIRVPLMFGADAVLVRAKSLAASHDGVAVERAVTPTHYVQLMLATQAVIFAEGVAIETVQPDGACDLEYQTIRSWELMAAVA